MLYTAELGVYGGYMLYTAVAKSWGCMLYTAELGVYALHCCC